jgi:peptidoglycan/xylan/chitin deacetylase (PgdA/CDA1 family)
MRSPLHGCAAALSLVCALHAAPVTTVPWNGHKGAISFTFDDGAPTQLTNVVPSLEKRGIHATFFVVGNSYGVNRSAWIKAAQDGNEISNHTMTHTNLTTVDTTVADSEITGMANTLRKLDPSIESVTLAYPNCATNDVINRIANREAIISRTCGWYARFPWNSTPSEWAATTSFIVWDDATSAEALTEIDMAANAGTWMVTLNHGVGGDWGAVTVPQVDSMFDRALARDLWVATYQDAAAYWRASKTMDTARAVPSGNGWTLSWTSPHRRMPRQVKLRVKLDTTVFGPSPVVTQGGAPIVRETDGSWVVDFMKLSLQVVPKGATSIARASASTGIRVQRTAAGLAVKGLGEGRWRYRLATPSGRIAASGTVASGPDGSIVLPANGRIATLLYLQDPRSNSTTLKLPAAF